MVNPSCDFCDNAYRKCPSAGYFKVTPTLKASLCLREGAGLDTICGDHFATTDILASGRLRANARPVFFPRHSTAEHDHPYYDSVLGQPRDEGKLSQPPVHCTSLMHIDLIFLLRLAGSSQ